ncbi:amidohydrolase family protein [Idiomarina loihiensis]|uniref:Amidohydrolase family enzyme n=1 Tax=Idiomarina loihiensis (strain ATCC BAA-735 / DSM 15497 / L2-TR) TaxID=283942 RepID=Q5QVB5_IDILO|nr:amidohydrolase family protein [Idiomarina loihiensis]AAV82933.1 Amidohydrolase family enzyme [Idiomarina loihiensis L2TR]AGM36978.1 amidohydrolase [Idiomarina loihiensis GSL 199]
MKTIKTIALAMVAMAFTVAAYAVQAPPKAPERDRGEGPYERLVLRGGTLINGEGAPPFGPVDIVIENDRIVNIVSVGNPGVPIKPEGRPEAGANDKELDVSGKYILPGFVDMHGHIGGSAKGIPAEYVLKLWLGHGITTIREPGSFNGLDWVQWHEKRAADNRITSPRIIPYVGFGQGWDKPIYNGEQAREWVRYIKDQGAKGIKFFGASRKVMEAALDEANKQGLGTMMHHAQLNVMSMNALDSARSGLTSMEHWYGLPEALFEEQRVQDYPADYNYNNEQNRFEEAGRLWKQAAEPGSEKWNAVRDELIELDFTINPTLTIYEASRDLMRERQAIWHDEYTLPRLWDFFEPSRYAHGSYWFDWTTDNEIAWKKNYQKWMTFLKDFHENGGRITTGSDSGYIYKIYGFGYIRELELLREAGLNALEVIHAASLAGAEALNMEDDIGSVAIGKKADMVIVNENPMDNFKVLYGTGHFKLDDNNQPMRTEGIQYTIKDGIIFDAQQLLQDVKAIVAEEKADRQK